MPRHSKRRKMMSAKGISMRKFKMVLRLHFKEALSVRDIANRVILNDFIYQTLAYGIVNMATISN
jgi:hypothetical protein